MYLDEISCTGLRSTLNYGRLKRYLPITQQYILTYDGEYNYANTGVQRALEDKCT